VTYVPSLSHIDVLLSQLLSTPVLTHFTVHIETFEETRVFISIRPSPEISQSKREGSPGPKIALLLFSVLRQIRTSS
jgi:hypothetical protein